MKVDVVTDQAIGLINGLRVAINVTDKLQGPIIAGAVEKHIIATYDAAYAQAIEDAATVADKEIGSTRHEIATAIRKLKTS